ncbi:acyltransferase family protein [Staphylococcus capitis]|uniref:acyltransferase family protein n=2 Tax=Staphylococcus TaxID=1279 RepID=UPI0016556226|nr:acyltransferase family protein [Staphylococcus capitis]MBC8781660.1 acetyltransferase [Staphylococcus capitis]MCM3508459.1 acetyltransferase [Staphylococcus capitis]MDH9600929.1 acyltransferase family protein [Staphylococcus capitis]MDH9623323.1 acyltransferase family protein [Staphylococcus capitis]MDS4063118.1 acyltransferase family protein [Staphylococcus capitis]
MDKENFKRLDKAYKPHYLPGLDGLRAIAVIGIIIYHLNTKWLSGGFLGVDTFFVISGYLITSLLISEYYRNNSIDLVNFWIRRIKRLIPAVLFLIAVVLIFTLFFKPDLIISIKHDAIAACFYVSNWWYIFQDVDYFNQFSVAPLKHLWSLAIEEQFYLFYPIILLGLLKFFKKKTITLILIVVSLLSLLAMIVIHMWTGNNSRVYFGTDTRLQTLLLGCILAFVWPPFSFKKDISKKAKSGISLVGLVGIIVLIYLFITISDQDKWIYSGGFYAISFLTLFVIASVVHPSSLIKKILSFSLFIYIGKRSYSLYLWHYPIIVFMNSYYVQGQIPWYVYICEIILMFIMAEVSYQFIETPFRKKGFKAFTILPTKFGKFTRTLVVILLLIPSFFVIFGSFDSLGKKHEEQQASKQKSFTTNNKPKPAETNDDQQNNDKKEFNVKKASPLLLGDSVMVDIGEVFSKKVPNANVDGKVGRQLIEGKDIVNQKYQDYTKKGQNVVVELGTNGEFTKDQLNDLIKSLGDADVYLITVRVPRDYEQNNNKLMEEAAKKHKNVHLVDWYNASGGHQDYFAYDGIHLEYSGDKALSDEIIKKMKEVNEQSN